MGDITKLPEHFNANHLVQHKPEQELVQPEEMAKYVKGLMYETKTFTHSEIEFTEGILTRLDGQPGLQQITPIITSCVEYITKLKSGEITPWDKFQMQQKCRQAFDFVKITAYKQHRVLIAVPQRKQHPKYNIPNLNGLIASQAIRVDMDVCYNLGYTESRKYFVKKALQAGSGVTRVMFIDDDILVPVNVVERLVSYNLPVVGGIYVKKNPTLESVATCPLEKEGAQYIFENSLIHPDENNHKPQKVGCFGLGMMMFDIDVFKMPELKDENIWFQFVREIKDGQAGRVLVGEDSRLCQVLSANGIYSHVIPSIVGIHVDVKTGIKYAPKWLVNPETNQIVDKYKPLYTTFPADLNLKELAAPDNDNVFSMSSQWT